LVGDDEAPAIEEIVVMWQEEAEADSPTTSNTAPKRRRCSACSAILAEDEGTPDPVKGAEDRVLCDTCAEEADDTEGSGLDDEEDGEELVLEA
jgi:hypothetical protein